MPKQKRAPRSGRSVTVRRSKGLGLRCAIVAAFFASLVALSAVGLVPPALIGVYFAMSIVSLAMYGLDKAAAEQGRWRTAEAKLHLVAVAGGWPGALLAQRMFRHKTRKRSFQTVFWCAVIGNCAAFVWLLSAS
ncbi:DNA-binding protein [Alkalilimnicola ehrlichii]|uniref:DNA-binding protein n=1 Tax=Alkalilimnicola ehrlichii TaxID=351052 RepID=A0A3E0WKE5_9GAMM|nr:DUF1294 domain-containing protein [Alkalilimnicola ehrlichii]RFA25535.1 DNA-binding protein [Alkalilimnicola ehrlichii]RFA32611.1 DNA-binding protein [Alkalilimnicola ehrlichii]